MAASCYRYSLAVESAHETEDKNRGIDTDRGQFHDCMKMRGKIKFNYLIIQMAKIYSFYKKIYNYCDIFFLLVLTLILYHITLRLETTYN